MPAPLPGYQLIHSFHALSGKTYFLYANFSTQAYYIEFSPGGAPDASVTADELHFNGGDQIASKCVDADKIIAIAQLEVPFFHFSTEANSADCDFTPPDCEFAYIATPTNATNGGANGKIDMTLDFSGPTTFQFSLDNSVWQTSPTFNFLFPGDYIVYVRNGAGCVISYLVTVGNTVVPNLVPITFPFQQSNRVCYFFRLIIDGDTHAIREPIKWDDVNLIGERDEDFHGYMAKYTDGNVSLGFDCPAGKDFIEAVYNSKGQDGDIKFQYGYSFDGDEFILFPGKLMLNTYKLFPDRVECTVETGDLDTTFTSRLETKVSMTQDKSFDDEAVPVPTPYEIELHAKEIYTKVRANTTGGTFESIGFTAHTEHYYIKPENLENEFSEIEEYLTYPLGGQLDSPFDIQEYILKPQSSGHATIAVNLNLDVVLFRSGAFGGGATGWGANALYVTKKFSSVTNSYQTVVTNFTTGGTVTGDFSPGGSVGSSSFNIQGVLNVEEDFLKDDEAYIYIAIDLVDDDFGIATKIKQNNFTLSIDYLERSAATRAKGWFLEDVVRHCINVIGNNKYAFKSSFFERMNISQLVDGCGSKNLVTNGFQIRNFDIANRPLKLDLKKILKSLNAIWCIGLNYSNDSSGSYVRIERRDFYYQDREIIAIEELESYHEEVAIDIIYNELEFGYEKYQDSGFNSLDEFNTKIEALTPIKKNKKKLVQKSDLITSGYAIESIRREQFKDSPSSSVSNDEEPFMTAVKRVDAANWQTEKDEAFEIVTGLISPATAYNLRYSPTRMIFNWFIWLKGIFAYKVSADKITKTFITQNTSLITQFNGSEECRVGDVDRAIIEEKADITMDEMASTPDIWRPERVFVKCRLNPAQVLIINQAMTSRYGDDKDRGYIMVKKPNGIWQAFWLDKLSYNFYTETAEISGKKKFTSPGEPNTEDCCRYLVINGCYILINDEKLIA